MITQCARTLIQSDWTWSSGAREDLDISTAGIQEEIFQALHKESDLKSY